MKSDYDPNTHTLKITDGTTITDYSSLEDTPWGSYVKSIKNIEIYSGITSVGSNAFPASVEKLTIPCALKDNTNLPSAGETELKHDTANPVYHAKVDATYTTTGMQEYYSCGVCGKLFTDSALTNETTKEALVIAKKTDKTAPVPNEIVLTATSVTILNSDVTVGVYVDATDSESGIRDGYITFYNTSAGKSVSCQLSSNSGSVYNLTGNLNVYESIPKGTYLIESLTLTDNVGNSHTYSYSELNAISSSKLIKYITVSRNYRLTPTLTVSFESTSVGYGGTLKGTVKLMDSKGNPISGKSLVVYSGTTKICNVTTTSDGTAEFSYTNKTAGSYQVKATYAGDEDYSGVTSNSVTVTFTTVPATGDTYNVAMWSAVVAAAIGINAWFIINRKRTA